MADPNQGPNGDPDNDGLTNQDESALGRTHKEQTPITMV